MSESPKERIPEEDDITEAPLTMAASVVLTNLPKDASKALETAGNLTVQKGIAVSFYLSCFLFLNTEHILHIHISTYPHILPFPPSLPILIPPPPPPSPST